MTKQQLSSGGMFAIGLLLGAVCVFSFDSFSSGELKSEMAYVQHTESINAAIKSVLEELTSQTASLDKTQSLDPSVQPVKEALGETNANENALGQAARSAEDSVKPLGVSGLAILGPESQKPEWQIHMDWSFQNKDAGGAVNCTGQYFADNEWKCIALGGRACVMTDAKNAANSGSPRATDAAFELALLTQCHNREALAALHGAGATAVVRYVSMHPTY